MCLSDASEEGYVDPSRVYYKKKFYRMEFDPKASELKIKTSS